MTHPASDGQRSVPSPARHAIHTPPLATRAWPSSPLLRRNLVWTAASLLVLLLCEASGADLAVMRLFADGRGFAWRDHWLLAQVLHGGGRALAWGLLALMLAHTLRRDGTGADRAAAGTAGNLTGTPAAPNRSERVFWLLVAIATAVAVPGIKRVSLTSCPWDLAEFGGVARFVPHWLVGVADGGPGHCFPSGHAAAVLAFTGVYFLWRPSHPQRARRLLAGVWLLGAVYGTVQVLRGAHLPSHVLWAAWLCWVIALAADTARTRWTAREAAAPPDVSR